MHRHWKMVSDKSWRSKIDPRYTVEIGALDEYDEEDPESIAYYVFPAHDGKGIPNSPETLYSGDPATDLKDAIVVAREIMSRYSGPDLDGFSWRFLDEPLTPKPKARRKPKTRRESTPKSSIQGIGRR